PGGDRVGPLVVGEEEQDVGPRRVRGGRRAGAEQGGGRGERQEGERFHGNALGGEGGRARDRPRVQHPAGRRQGRRSHHAPRITYTSRGVGRVESSRPDVPPPSVGPRRLGPTYDSRQGNQPAARHAPRASHSSQYTPADTAAAIGIVSTQAIRMFRATPHRTADTRFDAPTPMMLAEITCVVLTGACRWLAVRITAAAAVSAANPLIGRSRMIL